MPEFYFKLRFAPARRRPNIDFTIFGRYKSGLFMQRLK